MKINATQVKTKQITRTWHLLDAHDEILGRLATEVARLLIGKHKVSYLPHIDSGDYVVVINSRDVRVTGNKEDAKVYYRHSGYPGGLRLQKLSDLREKDPNKIIIKAVYNMLPKNRLRRLRMRRLKIFADSQHPYQDKIVS